MKIVASAATVVSVHRIARRMLRVRLAAADMADTGAVPGDYVRLLFTLDGSAPPVPSHTGSGFDWPEGPRPIGRNLTIAYRDPAGGTIDLDVIVHPAASPLQQWIEVVQPGTPVGVAGPGAGHSLDTRASEAIVAGDESALPAIRTLLADLSHRIPTTVLIEVEDADDRDGEIDRLAENVVWLERRGVDRGQLLAERFAVWSPTTSDPEVWMAGEHGVMRAIRQRLRRELGLQRHRSIAVPYWRAGANQEDNDARVAAVMESARRRSIPMTTTQDVNELFLDDA